MEVFSIKRFKLYIEQILPNLMLRYSPTGYTSDVSSFVAKELSATGLQPIIFPDNSIIVNLSGSDKPSMRILTAHMDTLGGMINYVKPNGRLCISPIGGLNANNIETENCRVITRSGKWYSGTIQLENASIHVNKNYNSIQRDFSSIEVVLDTTLSSSEDVHKLGIKTGDVVCIDARLVFENGYIKSRYLDDKLGVAILLYLCKELSSISKQQNISMFFSSREETGNGCAQLNRFDFHELLAVDMGCIGNDLSCDETKVSICAMDNGGPYDYNLTGQLIRLAENEGIPFAVDIYPYYKSDACTAIRAGANARCALIGPGIYASHGYERGHISGAYATYRLLHSYILSSSELI